MNRKRILSLFIISTYFYGCKQEILYPQHFKFDFCQTCITAQDFVDYEINLGSLKLNQLSDYQHARIFEKINVSRLGVEGASKDTKFNLYFLRKDSAINNFILTSYQIRYDDSLKVLPLSKTVVWYTDKKFFFYDSYFDSIIDPHFIKPFDIKLQRGIAIAIEDSVAALFNKKGIRYQPLNLERTADFPFKNEIYGVGWGNMQVGAGVEFNYNLSPELARMPERNVKEENMSIYYSYQISSSEFLDSVQTMIKKPDFNSHSKDSILKIINSRRTE